MPERVTCWKVRSEKSADAIVGREYEPARRPEGLTPPKGRTEEGKGTVTS
jgi:hypothetical protein